MAKPTKQQEQSTSPLDAAFVAATGKSVGATVTSWEQGGDWTAVARALDAVAQHGGAVMLGRTRDGGQLTVGIYLKGDKTTHYFDNTEQALTYLDAVGNIAGAL
jgi:hypothetical protein